MSAIITSQKEFIANFNNDPTTHYNLNEAFFRRSDEKILYYLKLIYKSIQRTMGVDSYFTIEVRNFEVVEDYNQIREILSKYQEILINKSTKLKGAIDNRYDYIDLKASDLKLLIVTFYIEAYDGKELIESLMAVPRVINKFYFRINNNYLFSMHQLVDASTYNNQTSSNAKSPLVVMKNIFPPISVFRNMVTYEDVAGRTVNMITYEVDIFKKSVPACEYIFAHMSLNKGLAFLGLDGVFLFTKTMPEDFNYNNYYVFNTKKDKSLFIIVPKSLFDANYIVQHITAALCLETSKKFMTLENMFSQNTWLESLGRHFSISTFREKAISVLTSLESMYDLITFENTRLDYEDKKDVYCILRWLINEYSALTLKDNLDVSIKRIRVEEYIAGLIAPKLSRNIYALSDMGEKVNLDHIKRRINIPYDYLINELSKQSIVVYNDIINDCDSFIPLKISRNGPSSISEKNGNAALPLAYRLLHISSLGIMDDSASGNSAPGISGVVSPLGQLYEPGGYFLPEDKFSEPNTWRSVLFQQLENVRQELGKKEIVEFRTKILEASNLKYMTINDFKLTEEDKARLIATANR